jgi:predicted Zn-dependent protease
MSMRLDPRAPQHLLADPVVITRDESERIIEQVRRLNTLDAVSAAIRAERTRNVRFAANQMATAGVTEDTTLSVTSYAGRRRASVTTNDLSPESIERTVRKAEAAAKLAPEDPEFVPLLGAQTYSAVANAYDDATADLDAATAMQAAQAALAPARRSNGALQVAGFVIASAEATALGNSAGLFAYHRGTLATSTLTVRTGDGTGSGWAGDEAVSWRELDFAGVSARALEKAERSRNPVAVEPGRWTVILEPQAVADLISLMPRYFNARSAEEGRSPFSRQGGGSKVGEQIVNPMVTLISDPADVKARTAPFGGDGLPLTRQTWIENGVLRTMAISRAWAARRQLTPTGTPNSVQLIGGTTSRDAMIASTPRGILVTRLWYLREVDPRTMVYTGLTRDGTYLIENGRVTRAIKNLRFNESPLFMLNNLESLGPTVRTPTEGGPALIMPTLKARDFNFTSLSDAV